MSIELNAREIQGFTGYLHQYNSLEFTFFHKSSEPKFNVITDGTVNFWSYQVTSTTVEASMNSVSTCSEIYNDQDDCYIKHLEKVLDCKLHWHSNGKKDNSA